MVGVNAIAAANVLLGDEAVKVPKMADVIKGKNIHYLPTYGLIFTTAVGTIIIIVGGVIKNYPVVALGGLFTVSSAVGAYYSWKYLQTKPLEEQVTLMTKLVARAKKSAADVQSTAVTLQDTESKLKNDNSSLERIIDDYQKKAAEGVLKTEADMRRYEDLVKRNEANIRELEKNKEFVETLKNEITQITSLLSETNKAGEVFKSSLEEEKQIHGSLIKDDADIKADVEKIAKENKEFEEKRIALTGLLKILRDNVKALLKRFEESQAEIEKEKKLLQQLEAHMDLLKQSSSAEQSTSSNLVSASSNLQSGIDNLAEVVRTLKNMKEKQGIFPAAVQP